jgi:hypothetical protein
LHAVLLPSSPAFDTAGPGALLVPTSGGFPAAAEFCQRAALQWHATGALAQASAAQALGVALSVMQPLTEAGVVGKEHARSLVKGSLRAVVAVQITDPTRLPLFLDPAVIQPASAGPWPAHAATAGHLPAIAAAAAVAKSRSGAPVGPELVKASTLILQATPAGGSLEAGSGSGGAGAARAGPRLVAHALPAAVLRVLAGR